MDNHLLIAFLKEQGLITEAQAADLLEEQERSGKNLEQIIVDYGIVSEEELMGRIAEYLGLTYVDVTQAHFTPELLSSIPPQSARIHGALPVGADEFSVTVALTDPLNQQNIDDLQWTTGKSINAVVANFSQLRDLIQQFYGSEDAEVEDLVSQLAGEVQETDGASAEDLNSVASSAPIVKYVNTVIAKAIQAQASDVHFEPFEKEMKIRYRVDGAL